MPEEFNPLTGAQVAELHKSVVDACKEAGKTGYDLLACIVDGMRCAYALAETKGYDVALETVKKGISEVLAACPI